MKYTMDEKESFYVRQKCRCSFLDFGVKREGLNPSSPNDFLTMGGFNEFYHFDIFLHIDVLEIFNFNHTKVNTILSSMHKINCEKF